MSHWAVNKCCPEEDERYDGKYAASFACASYCDCTDRCLEDELELAEEDGRYRPNRVSEHASVESILKVADYSGAFPVCKSITNNPPLDGTDTDREHCWVEGSKTIPTRAVTGICKTDRRNDRPTKDATHEDEEGIRPIARLPRLKDR